MPHSKLSCMIDIWKLTINPKYYSTILSSYTEHSFRQSCSSPYNRNRPGPNAKHSHRWKEISTWYCGQLNIWPFVWLKTVQNFHNIIHFELLNLWSASRTRLTPEGSCAKGLWGHFFVQDSLRYAKYLCMIRWPWLQD